MIITTVIYMKLENVIYKKQREYKIADRVFQIAIGASSLLNLPSSEI